MNPECPKIFQQMAKEKKEYRYIIFMIQVGSILNVCFNLVSNSLLFDVG